MLNPFSISLAVQPLEIYSGLCLKEGSSLTCPTPLIMGEKTNSHPADPCLTIPFPSLWDTWPLPHHQSPLPPQPHQRLGDLPWHRGCPSAKHPMLRYPQVPVSRASSQCIPGMLS